MLLFNETIQNIIRNFIPDEIVTCDDRVMTTLIKKAIKDKNLFYQRFVKNTDFTNNDSNLERFCSLQNNLTNTIETATQQYFAKFAKKLSETNISSKTYWSISKCSLTGKKVPCIPPTFHKNISISNFKEKAELFKSFFANQSSLVRNSSALPFDFELFTDKSLSNITFADNDTGRIIRSLDPKLTVIHDKYPICGDSINKPLGLIFRACLEHGIFPQNWKKTNLVLIHKKTTSNQ